MPSLKNVYFTRNAFKIKDDVKKHSTNVFER